MRNKKWFGVKCCLHFLLGLLLDTKVNTFVSHFHIVRKLRVLSLTWRCWTDGTTLKCTIGARLIEVQTTDPRTNLFHPKGSAGKPPGFWQRIMASDVEVMTLIPAASRSAALLPGQWRHRLRTGVEGQPWRNPLPTANVLDFPAENMNRTFVIFLMDQRASSCSTRTPPIM